ncbi:MAG: cupin domain-containing protein [Bacteroidales bacterium]
METKTIEASVAFEWNLCVEYSSNGIISKRVIDRPTGNVTLFAFDKGQRLSEHSAPYDALVQVTEGEAKIVIGGQPHYLKAGQCIIMPANVPHAVNALKNFKMVLTMIKG